MSKVNREAFDSELVQLTIPFNAKPFLDFKKRVRGRNRTAFDKIQEGAQELKYALQRDEIQSTEARLAVREFLRTIGLQ
jgi:hypothetical protein